jgi:hypothetical protein
VSPASKVNWKGDKSLRSLLIPVGEIAVHPGNPRRGNLDRIGESLDRFGQVRPIVIQRSRGYIVAGNHTYRAGIEKHGWTHIAGVRVDLTDQEAEEYLIADNRTSDLGEYDDTALVSILSRLQDEGRLYGTGYTPDEIDDEIARIKAIAETDPEPFLGQHSETEDELAARRAARAAAPIMREVVLMFDPDTYVRFGQWVKMLQREYETNGVIETVHEAVKREATRVNQEGGDGG